MRNINKLFNELFMVKYMPALAIFLNIFFHIVIFDFDSTTMLNSIIMVTILISVMVSINSQKSLKLFISLPVNKHAIVKAYYNSIYKAFILLYIFNIIYIIIERVIYGFEEDFIGQIAILLIVAPISFIMLNFSGRQVFRETNKSIILSLILVILSPILIAGIAMILFVKEYNPIITITIFIIIYILAIFSYYYTKRKSIKLINDLEM